MGARAAYLIIGTDGQMVGNYAHWGAEIDRMLPHTRDLIAQMTPEQIDAAIARVTSYDEPPAARRESPTTDFLWLLGREGFSCVSWALAFGRESLMCEAAIVVDLQRRMVDFYSGYICQPHDQAGPWGPGETVGYTSYDNTTYYPVALVASVAFAKMHEFGTIEPLISSRMRVGHAVPPALIGDEGTSYRLRPLSDERLLELARKAHPGWFDLLEKTLFSPKVHGRGVFLLGYFAAVTSRRTADPNYPGGRIYQLTLPTKADVVILGEHKTLQAAVGHRRRLKQAGYLDKVRELVAACLGSIDAAGLSDGQLAQLLVATFVPLCDAHGAEVEEQLDFDGAMKRAREWRLTRARRVA